MSNHSVVIRKISEINKHPNADKLDLVKLEGLGYTIIVQKDTYSIGDEVLLFQDSLILPQALIDLFELKYLHKGMVKPAKIRGVVSQAMVLPLDEFIGKSDENIYLNSFFFEYLEHKTDSDYDYSNVLGITRKEDVIGVNQGKTKGNLPDGVEKYDLESVERYQWVFESLLDTEVEITEKLEGTNFAVHVTKNGDEYKYQYCSRNLVKEDGLYQLIPQKQGISEFAEMFFRNPQVESVTVRGEIVGQAIQGNIYQLNEQVCYVFDIKVNGEYMTSLGAKTICDLWDVKYVPVLYEGLLRGYASTVDSIKSMSDGKSGLNVTTDREGIVIKTRNHPRVTLKQRSPQYLSK